MKKKLFYSTAIVGLLLTSCKKDDKTTPETTQTQTPATPTYVIAKDSVYDSTPSDTEVRLFIYDNSKKLVKIKYKYGTSTSYTDYDTIIYNGSSQVAFIYEYSIGSPTPYDTATYSYSSGNLSSIVSSAGDTLTLFYTAGKVTTIYQYSNSRDTLSSIIYINNNISTLVYDGTPVTANIDLTAPNPYYGIPDIQNVDFINLVNRNNLTTAYPTATPGTKLQDDTYTYSNGRVATIVDNQNSTTTVITYKEL